MQAAAEQMQIFVELVEQQLGFLGAGRGHAALDFIKTAPDDGQPFFDELMEGRRTNLGRRGRPFVGAVGQLAAQDMDVRRRVDAEADDAGFDADDLNDSFQVREDNGFIGTAGQDKHGNPFTKQQW